jgi:hypothetical protein
MTAFYTSSILRMIALCDTITTFATTPNKDFCAVIGRNPPMPATLKTADDKRFVIAKNAVSTFCASPISHDCPPMIEYKDLDIPQLYSRKYTSSKKQINPKLFLK